MFSVGDRIVYPMHGAGIISKIEEKKILGERKHYYILQLPNNDIDIMVPVDTSEEIGVRGVVDKEVIEIVASFLRSESSIMDSNWNRRYRENMEKLKSGDILQVAEVVRNLVRVEKGKRLSAGEKKLLQSAKQILKSEIMLVLDMDEEEAEKLLYDNIFA